MRSRFGRFIDAVFACLLMWLASFVILRSLWQPRISFLISIVIALITLRCVIYYQNKRYHDLNIKAAEQNELELNNFELRKLPDKLKYDFFTKLLKNENPEASDDGLIFHGEILLLVYVDEPTLNNSHLFKANFIAEKMENLKEIIIVCNAVSPDVQTFSTKFPIPFTFFTPLETYALMKKSNYFLVRAKKTQKKHTFKLKNHVFLKKQAKNFFRIGFLLYLACLFVPFVKTYIITASVSTVLGLICLLFGKTDAQVKSYGKELLSLN